MRAISVKKEYEKDWERLMKHGVLETNGNSARYITRLLMAHKLDGNLKHFRNTRTKRSVIMLGRTVKRMKKRPGWKKVGFYPIF